MRPLLLALAVAVIPACKSSDDAPKLAASNNPAVAGTVLEVHGTVTVADKPLAKGDTVTADATIDTGPDGAVTIELAHNQVRLELGPNKHVRVDESVAWKAPRRVEPTEHGEGATTSAGRPAERMAAGTSITEGERAKAESAPASDRPTESAREAVSADKATPSETANGAPDPATKETSADDFRAKGKLGISGAGPGGGGAGGGGIGLGGIGTLGHGGGAGTGQGYGRGGGGASSPAPTLTKGTPQISGKLAPAVVNRIVLRQRGALRQCYEQALHENPSLAGKVTIRFVIGSDGTVSQAADAGSTLGDSAVVGCIVKVFTGMKFPAPESGTVTVSYPLLFSR